MANPKILIVGRLSGPKNAVILEVLRKVAPAVLRSFPRARFTVVGGPVAEEHLRLQGEEPAVRFEGSQKDLKPYYLKATVVIGAGRVALEAMALKKPVVAIGERLYVGPLLPDKFRTAKETNFGDCWDVESFDWAKMAGDLLGLLNSASLRARVARAGWELLRSDYDWKGIFPKMEALYRQVILQKNVSLFHEIPVLMYHRVVGKEPKGSKYNLHILHEDMEEQMRRLRDRGFETLVFEDLLTRRMPRKPILLTFDDGYEDNYHHLFPLLQKYRMKAVLYLLGNRRHKNNFWDMAQGEPEARLLKEGQIREMDRSGWVEFGAHSLNHVSLPGLKAAEVRREVEGSKKSLEKLLGKTVFSFAYPYGNVDAGVKQITAAAGYTFGVAVQSGPTRFGQDLMEIRRVHIFPKTPSFGFWRKTSGWYLRYRRLLGKNT